MKLKMAIVVGILLFWGVVIPSSATPLKFEISYFYGTSGKSPSYRLKDGNQLHTGDTYRITFTPKQDSYVYIIEIDVDGHVKELLSESRIDNHVKADKMYHVPGPTKMFKLDKSESIGQGTIYFVPSTSPKEDILNKVADAREGNVAFDREKRKALEEKFGKIKGSSIVDDPVSSDSQLYKFEDGESHSLSYSYFP